MKFSKIKIVSSAFTAAVFALSGARAAADDGAASILIKVEGVAAEGAVRAAVFTSEDNWKADKAAGGVEIDVAGGETEAVVDGLKPGEAAVRAYHDLNGDGKLNMNPFGIPTEPFAFSNDAKARFGPPKYGAAKIEIVAGETVVVLNFGG
ncbi:MAG: DUF2141 domain-containing protein [Pseudomonadota bacterium]